MGATVDALHRLQDIELQIAEVRQRIERKHRAAKRQGKNLAEIDANIENKESALRADQMEADRLELDLKSQEAAVSKLRQALNVSKTNKEYSAVLTQLNTNKADISKLEESELAVINQVEAKRKEIAIIREQRTKEAAKLEELKAGAREVEASLKDRLVRLQAERDEAAAAVPASALVMFNRVAQKHDGEAMAMVFRTHPKRGEYACEGCNMSITLEQVNTILSRDEAVLCNTCGRILYLESPATSSAP